MTAGGGPAPAEPGRDVLTEPAFARLWTAATLSGLGSAVTTVAVPVLLVSVLHATPVELGVVNAVQLLPYLLFGLVVGVLLDRVRRRPALVWASVGRAVVLAVVPVAWWAGALSLPLVAATLFVFGLLSLVGTAAVQAYLPTVVASDRLLPANARLDQSAAVAQTGGPAVGGAVVGLLGAPVALLVDAVSYVVDAVLIARIAVEETVVAPVVRERVRDQIADGLRWAYRHRSLAPLAWSTHVWFFGNALALTVLPLFVLRELALSSLGYGLLLAGTGVGALAGAFGAARAGRAWGPGRVIGLARLGYPLAWALIALAPAGDGAGTWTALAAGSVLAGVSAGLENANEMAYRQVVTPARLQGRTNATLRSANRSAAVAGALVGGVVATAWGNRGSLWLAVGVFLAAAVVVLASPARAAAYDDAA
ncbi:MFS transporter [Luteimicrobium sp. NPDC057192]|uniref:MFS transporter n=1 Tax=Luteimicrobium sp. NPDC057192 TaxID=3346042 RepID=UPI00362DE155